jgi:hypothetical protein
VAGCGIPPTSPRATTRLPGGRPGKLGLRWGGMLPSGSRVVGLRQVDRMPHGSQRARSSLVAGHRKGITTLGTPSHGPTRNSTATSADGRPRRSAARADPSSGPRVRLGTTWGPHALQAGRRPARRLIAPTALAPPLTRADAYSHVLGVKGSQVQILSSRRPIDRGFAPGSPRPEPVLFSGSIVVII